ELADLLIAHAIRVGFPLRQLGMGDDGAAEVDLPALVHDLLELLAADGLVIAVQVLLADKGVVVDEAATQAAAPDRCPILTGARPTPRPIAAARPLAADLLELVDERVAGLPRDGCH